MTRRRTMLALFASLLLAPLAVAQGAGTGNLIPADLPACAKSCTLIQQAAGSCLSNPASAQSCFCQSALLAPIKSSPNNVCAPTCSDADFTTIANWYKSSCANGGTGSAGGSGSSGGQPAAGAAPGATPTPSSNPDSNAESPINQNQTGSEWWSSHYQWVIMVIVLALGFTAIGVGGRIWYRRRHRKVDGEIVEAEPETAAPDMSSWAPSRHSVHDIAGPSSSHHASSSYPYASSDRPLSTVAALPQRQPTNSKGKGREGLGADRPGVYRTPSQRLQKAMEKVQM